MRLWGRKSSINVQKVLWCLAELGLKEVFMFWRSFYQHGVGDLFGIDFLKGTPDLFDKVL